jgi:trehalose/maltose transport system permease protein
VKARLSDALVLLALAVYVLPVVWEARTALTPDAWLLEPWRWWPVELTASHFRAVFAQSPLPRALWNSLGVAFSSTVAATVLGTLGAYALARLPVRGRRALMLGIVMSTAFPTVATVAPLYLIVRALGLRDTWAALVLADASFALPLTLWLVARFIRELPKDLEEAAFVDGAGRLGALWRVTLPAVAPGIVAAALLAFLFSWNEFLFAYTFTATDASRTVPVALALFPGVFEVPWGDLAAAALLASIPPVVIASVFQRYLVQGLLAGALKDT